MAGTLYLLPNALGETALAPVLPQPVIERLHGLRYFIAENPKNARALLKKAGTETPLQDIRIERLDEHTKASALPALIAPLLAGEDGGLVSDAGCPAVADPGSPLIRLAHQNDIR